MNIPPLTDFINIKHTLPAMGTWRESVHVFDERSAQAIRAALAAGRPLLVRGDPGTGKSQLARAAAKVLGRKFLSQVVDAHTEIQDLWYRFDAVSRLGNAQLLSIAGKETSADAANSTLNPQHYLSPGILWWAFAWDSAKQHHCKHKSFKPDARDTGDSNQGVVLLLDEIDKADADLPNSLLTLCLPTEAQWEYACRAGTLSPFSCGESCDSTQVNFNGTMPYKHGTQSAYRRKTVAVKTLPANPWGLYEMHGNVWEWCQDSYGSYPTEPTLDPQGATSGVLRGGSWIDDGRYCRSANRCNSTPDDANDYIGFRLARGYQVS